MDALQRLIEEDAIKRLKARYFRCMDTKDWQGFAAVFTEDIVLQHDQVVNGDGTSSQPVTLSGRQAIIDGLTRAPGRKQTVHHGHMPEIDILSDTEAKGIWAMEDIVDFGTTVIHGMGHYHETYRKMGGEWRIARVYLTRLRLSQITHDRLSL